MCLLKKFWKMQKCIKEKITIIPKVTTETTPTKILLCFIPLCMCMF